MVKYAFKDHDALAAFYKRRSRECRENAAKLLKNSNSWGAREEAAHWNGMAVGFESAADVAANLLILGDEV